MKKEIELKEEEIKIMKEEENRKFIEYVENVQKVEYFNKLFQILSTLKLEKGINAIYISNCTLFKRFILENSKYFKINNDFCEHLYQKDLLEPILKYIFYNFDAFLFELSYPSKLFIEISKIIYYMTKQNKETSKQIQVVVNVNQNEYFEQEFEINEIINVFNIQSIIPKISEDLFKFFLSLVKITIPTSVTSIDANSFSG